MCEKMFCRYEEITPTDKIKIKRICVYVSERNRYKHRV